MFTSIGYGQGRMPNFGPVHKCTHDKPSICVLYYRSYLLFSLRLYTIPIFCIILAQGLRRVALGVHPLLGNSLIRCMSDICQNLQTARFIVQHVLLAHSATAQQITAQQNMPRTENSQFGYPQEGNIQLIIYTPPESSALYLEVPIAHIIPLCVRPRKFLRYIGWCIMGVEGHVSRDSPTPIDNIGDDGDLTGGHVYSYQLPEGQDLCLFHQLLCF